MSDETAKHERGETAGLSVAVIISVINMLVAFGAAGLFILLRLGWMELHFALLAAALVFGGASIAVFVGIGREWRSFVMLFVALAPWVIQIALLPAVIELTGCCEEEPSRSWEQRMLGSDYELVFGSLTVSSPGGGHGVMSARAADTRGDPFISEHVAGFVSQNRNGFRLEITNMTDGRIHLLWNQSRFVDEHDQEHPLYDTSRGRPDRGFLEPQSLASWEHARFRVAPVNNYQTRRRHGLTHGKRLDLVPANLPQHEEAEAKRQLQRLAETQTPVKLMLPIEIAGQAQKYEFSFVVKPRAEVWYSEESEEQVEDSAHVISRIEGAYRLAE
jgi:hypothetical protein